MKEIITLPLMGALVGYGTNWLAIKMVFRPYEEKHIFGFRVPFTPGVMAKERYVFSKKLGDTLSENVITDEELLKHLQKIDFEEVVKNLINNIDSDASISTYINDEETVRAFRNEVKKLIISSTNEKNVQQLSNAIVNEIKNSVNNDTLSKIVNKDELVKIIKSFKHNDELFRLANNLLINLFRNEELLDTPLRTFLGEDVTIKIQSSVNKNIDTIRLDLLGFIQSENFNFIEVKIENLVSAGIASIPLASMFGGGALAKTITPVLKETIIEYLQNEENNPEIAEFIYELLDGVLDSETRKITELISQEIMFTASQKIIVEICNGLANNVDSLGNSINTEKLFASITTVINDKMDAIIFNIINGVVNDETKIDNLSYSITEKILTYKYGELTNNVSDTAITVIADMLSKLFNDNISGILKSVNISEIVENKINSFEMAEAEKLVVDVMNKELKMITNLGGVLGFVIGCASLLI